MNVEGKRKKHVLVSVLLNSGVDLRSNLLLTGTFDKDGDHLFPKEAFFVGRKYFFTKMHVNLMSSYP